MLSNADKELNKYFGTRNVVYTKSFDKIIKQCLDFGIIIVASVRNGRVIYSINKAVPFYTSSTLTRKDFTKHLAEQVLKCLNSK